MPSELRSGNALSDDTRYVLRKGAACAALIICQYLRRWLQAFHKLGPDCQSACNERTIILLTISDLADKFLITVRHLNVICHYSSKFYQCHSADS
jgi:hypothetical protein